MYRSKVCMPITDGKFDLNQTNGSISISFQVNYKRYKTL